MEGPARRDADEESEEELGEEELGEEELGEEEEATPALAVKRPKKHSGASPLLVAAVPVPQDPAPPAPVFVARDPTLPPPEHHARGEPKPRYKRVPRLRCAQDDAAMCRLVPVRVLPERRLRGRSHRQLAAAAAGRRRQRQRISAGLLGLPDSAGDDSGKKRRASSSRARVCRVLEARAHGAARSQAQ